MRPPKLGPATWVFIGVAKVRDCLMRFKLSLKNSSLKAEAREGVSVSPLRNGIIDFQ